MIRVKRVYEPPSPTDGKRVLIDRLWPRGLTKLEARVDRWERDLAPSHELRKWFSHDPARFLEFRERYRRELRAHRDALADLAAGTERETVTLVFAAKDAEHSNAAVLQELLVELRNGGRPDAGRLRPA